MPTIPLKGSIVHENQNKNNENNIYNKNMESDENLFNLSLT